MPAQFRVGFGIAFRARLELGITRNSQRKQKWDRVGPADMGIEASRERARPMLQRVRDGLPAVEPKAGTFGEVSANWLKRHVEGKGLLSHGEIKRLLNVHILPVLKDHEFTSLRRGAIADLLDKVEDDHGARQADYVLAIIRQIANWYATRHEDYDSPIVRGMRRTNPKERARARTLTDPEIRAVWKVAETNGTFGALVRLSLSTAQRRKKVVTMRWADIATDGTWTIPAEAREKGNAGELVLPKLALDIIRAQPQIGDNPYALAGRGNGHFNGLSRAKRAFEKKLAESGNPSPSLSLG